MPQIDGTTTAILLEERPSKRVRPSPVNDVHTGDGLESGVKPHPLRIRPSGNAYTSRTNLKAGAGAFQRLEDELLMSLLEILSPGDLAGLGRTCKFLYAFTRHDELWRDLFIRQGHSNFKWHGSWRNTLLGLPQAKASAIDCSNVFADALYRPYQCACINVPEFVSNIPSGNEVPRLSDLSFEEYSGEWQHKPFILTEPVKQWPIYQEWSVETLLEKHRDIIFRAEAVDWPLEKYVDYMKDNNDESPLYLFDHDFAEKMNLSIDSNKTQALDYSPPSCFGPDLFTLLGSDRPHHRWLIIGPARSGSTFHKDPNNTSAWNAVITGSKYWLMFPSSSNTPPPGVFVTSDGAEVTAPLSIAEYLLTFHEIARRTPGCREGICHAGEVLHVPAGWFHMVVNLEDGIAVTQNFVPESKLPDVLAFMRDSPEQVSGFSETVSDPYETFVARLRESCPAVLEDALAVLEKRKGGQGRWERLVKATEVDGGSFSFGFGDDDVP
ncbi:Clavaminate synthase-like protein [Eremomyces bilateralis CBS 781.70]|uniref:Clavaminate synthase-like protein n=1 Tax=Eremomyces bilateralis CBS 781.70 TaxID=1392243 RepID=A0A6G1G0C1_9PEZI|nr:Clavaminate synthase-like protein [Eremomyces bilateralis CBS 781.70]KAF1811370.1 Clavaminate synthase-like protein [Eremomyces bilateralis CBS 781.70]